MPFAYVTLVMKGDAYVLGALVLAKGLRLSGTKHVIACMVTDDVSPAAREDLARAFDAVHVVKYFHAAICALKTEKMQKMYIPWMGVSLTWYEVLKLEQYEKVFLLDSDVVILRNMDVVFELSTPAGSFYSFFRSPFYGRLRHGDRVPSKRIQQALESNRGGYVCIGNGLLLSPSQRDWHAFKQCVSGLKRINKGVVGFPNSISGINEQMIAFFYVCLGRTWTHIGAEFQVIPWKTTKDCEVPPYLLHYFNIKPWTMGLGEFPDLQAWWRFAKAVVGDNDRHRRYISEELRVNLDSIETFLPHTCFWCKAATHTFIDNRCAVRCPAFADNGCLSRV
jgi:hypothetical protein